MRNTTWNAFKTPLGFLTQPFSCASGRRSLRKLLAALRRVLGLAVPLASACTRKRNGVRASDWHRQAPKPPRNPGGDPQMGPKSHYKVTRGLAAMAIGAEKWFPCL